MSNVSQGNVTKQKILERAASLFAEKGFTEASIRELTKDVGLKNPASLYNHFSSKNAILEHMLEEYTDNNIDVFEHRNITEILQANPTADGVLSCLQISYPKDRIDYYLDVLCVMLQEQLRNPLVCKYVSDQIILRAEVNMGKVIEKLKELGIVRPDTDPDYWVKLVSSLFYSFATRRMLGIGDNAQGYTGRSMEEMLRETFEIMLARCGGTAA